MRRHLRAHQSLHLLTLALCALVVVPTLAVAATYSVRADGNDWTPYRREIERGDRVVWRNPTNQKHDVTSRGSNWSYHVVLDPGESARRRFRRVGRFRYRCAIHSAIVDGECQGMCGVIVVRRP